MVGMKDEQDLQRVHHRRAHLVRLRRDGEHHREEVLDEVQLVIRVEERLADRLFIGVGGDRRQLRDQPHDRELDLLRVVRVRAVRVEGRERAHDRRQRAHRVGVAREPVEELLGILVEERVLADRAAELVSLGPRRELAVDEQIRRLEERGGVTGDERLDRDTPIAEDALLAVDERDRRLARPGVDEPVVQCDESRLRPELRDVDAQLVLGTPHDRELDLGVAMTQVRGLLVLHGALLRL